MSEGAPDAESVAAEIEALSAFCRSYPRLCVVTGAGCSTESGIGDYRDSEGNWKHSAPILYADFMARPSARRRYWARSLLGWPQFSVAQPNEAHHAIAALESQDRLVGVITQNVDRLHQQAGTHRVLDLHGRLDEVSCTQCGDTQSRSDLQQLLLALNADLLQGLRDQAARQPDNVAPAPDGDARISDITADFVVPDCQHCGGILKPDVIFYGQSVPHTWVEQAYSWVAEADALLVVGSSLMVFSSFRFCRAASRSDTPIAILNRGVTRADELATLKLDIACGPALAGLAERLS